MKFTQYFEAVRQRPDRALIQLEWIQRVIDNPVRAQVQADGGEHSGKAREVAEAPGMVMSESGGIAEGVPAERFCIDRKAKPVPPSRQLRVETYESILCTPVRRSSRGPTFSGAAPVRGLGPAHRRTPILR